MPFLIYCSNPLSLPVIYQDTRFKSLKPRCACTEVVLWLNDPPRYEHKSGAQASQYANIWQDCRSTKYEKIRKAAFDLKSYQSKKRNCGFYASQLPY